MEILQTLDYSCFYLPSERDSPDYLLIGEGVETQMDRFNKNLINKKKLNLLNVILITGAQDTSSAELAILNLEKLFCIPTQLNTYYKCNNSK